MTQPPDDLTRPIPADATHEQQAVDVPAVDAAAPGADAGAPPGFRLSAPRPPRGRTRRARATPPHPPDPCRPPGTARCRQSPGSPHAAPVAPVAPAAAAAEKASWRSRVSGGRGLAVAALVVGLGLGAVGGSVATWAVVHDNGAGTVADGSGGFDRDGDGLRPAVARRLPRGRWSGAARRPAGWRSAAERRRGTTGQLPGGGAGTDGSTGGTGSDANGTSQGT